MTRSNTELYDQAFELIFALHDEASEQAKSQVVLFKAQSVEHLVAIERAEAEWLLFGEAEVNELKRVQKLKLFLEQKTASLIDRPQQLMPIVAILLVVFLLPQTGWFDKKSSDYVTVNSSSSINEPVIETYTTAYGQQAEYTLEDGSVLSMNWNTELTIAFSDEHRQVTLSKGEAIFSVAKDLNRPFIVSVDNIQAKALGTEFSVHKIHNNHADIAVTEGVVEVSVQTNPETQDILAMSTVQLQASQTLVAKNNLLGAVEDFSITEISAWREGMLVFEQRSLDEVLAEINRYTAYNIVLEDPFGTQQEVSATFFIDNTDDALASLVQIFNLQTEIINQGRVTTLVVRPAAPIRPTL